MIDVANLVGLIGCASLVIAYLALLANRFQSNQYRFLFMNLIGSTLLCINGFMINAPFFYPLINIVWMFGTSYQIISKFLHRNKVTLTEVSETTTFNFSNEFKVETDDA
jgi:predicted membrane protein